jgi:hypothetical protein
MIYEGIIDEVGPILAIGIHLTTLGLGSLGLAPNPYQHLNLVANSTFFVSLYSCFLFSKLNQS